MLLAALQRRRRGIHISAMLRPDRLPPAATLPELRAARGTSMKLTSLLEVGSPDQSVVWQACTPGT